MTSAQNKKGRVAPWNRWRDSAIVSFHALGHCLRNVALLNDAFGDFLLPSQKEAKIWQKHKQ